MREIERVGEGGLEERECEREGREREGRERERLRFYSSPQTIIIFL